MDRAAFVKSSMMAGASMVVPPAPGPERRRSMKIQKLSWAGVRLEAEGVTLLLDPWEDVSFFGGAFPREPVRVTSDTERRYPVLSHLHSDHYDRAVVDRLLSEAGASGAVVASATAALELAGEGRRLRPHALWEPRSIGPFTLAPLPAVDGWGVDQVAWTIRLGDTRIFHGGDGLWHGRWWDYARAFGPFDLVFMPINGARTPRATPPVSVARTMPPVEAAEAAAALGAGRVVPIHYGVSVPGVYEETDGTAEQFGDAARARGLEVVWADDGTWIDP